MNPDIGAIAHFETEEDAKKAGYTIPLTKELAGKLQQMPRQDRLKLISNDVRHIADLHPLAQLAGMTDDDVRKLRNAAKRARRARAR